MEKGKFKLGDLLKYIGPTYQPIDLYNGGFYIFNGYYNCSCGKCCRLSFNCGSCPDLHQINLCCDDFQYAQNDFLNESKFKLATEVEFIAATSFDRPGVRN